MKNYKLPFIVSIAVNVALLGCAAYFIVDSALFRDDLNNQLIGTNDMNRAAFELLKMELVGKSLSNAKLNILAMKRNNNVQDESYDKDTYWVWNQIHFHHSNGRITNVNETSDF